MNKILWIIIVIWIIIIVILFEIINKNTNSEH